MRIKLLDAAEKDLEEGYWFYEAQTPVLAPITLIHCMPISTLLHISEEFTGSFLAIIACCRDGFPLLSTIGSSIKQWSFSQYLIVAEIQAGYGKD